MSFNKRTMWKCMQKHAGDRWYYTTWTGETTHGHTVTLFHRAHVFGPSDSGELSAADLATIAGAIHLQDLDLQKRPKAAIEPLVKALERCDDLECVTLPASLKKDDFLKAFKKEYPEKKPPALDSNEKKKWPKGREPYNGKAWYLPATWSQASGGERARLDANDNEYLGRHGETQLIYASNFGFAGITGTVVGVQVRASCRRVQHSTDPIGNLFTSDLCLTKGSGDWSENRGDLDCTNPWGDAYSDRGSGGATDSWNYSLTPAQVMSSGFGVMFRCENCCDSKRAIPYVDYISVEVWYDDGSVHTTGQMYPASTVSTDI